MSFYKLGIKSDLVYALECQNIDTPTPIQKLTIPKIVKGFDVLAEAQTGTGKTLAFLLPVFQIIDAFAPEIQVLIITPTRELAIQITAVAKSLADYKPIGLLAAYGGQDVNAQLHKLKSEIHMVVGTPGRILDHMRRGSITLDALKVLVIDEADQMFHIGFKNEVEEIISALPETRQTLCFSATLSNRVDSFSLSYLNNPITIVAPREKITLEGIEQAIIETSGRKKWADFVELLKREKPDKSIVFCRSRRGTDALSEEMNSAGYNVLTLHGDLSQAAREYAITAFKEGHSKFLIATDVAARGLDIDGVTHVFNYNLPDDPENYVHRIGRTGRAGETGKAFIILTEKDKKRLEAIEAFIEDKIKILQL